MDGGHSDPIRVSGTILPGCSLATTGAKILMFRLLRATQSNWPVVRTKNIVDDINMQANGNQAEVVSSIAGAAHQLTSGLFGAGSAALSNENSFYGILVRSSKANHTGTLAPPHS